MPLIRPRRLAPGQTIGLVAPSSAPNELDRLPFAAETIESLGFRVRTGKHLHEREGYLAGSDNARAHDLNAMFADDSIDAIWCVRGGYGASRLLPLLDELDRPSKLVCIKLITGSFRVGVSKLLVTRALAGLADGGLTPPDDRRCGRPWLRPPRDPPRSGHGRAGPARLR